jgi:hypothetical protein
MINNNLLRQGQRNTLMRGWILIFREVEVSRLVEISTLMKKTLNRTNGPLQSLHHDSIGYQFMHTRIDLTKKTYSYKHNREHKQEQKRMQLNLQMND